MKLRKILDFQVRQVGNPEDRILEFTGSTADVDRYGDIIEVAGWDLKNFKENPVILFGHRYSDLAVGTADPKKGGKVFTDDRGLVFRVYFPTNEEINAAGWPTNHPTPETLYRVYKNGIMKAVSVGFQGLEWDPIYGDPDEQGYRPRIGTRYKKQELYELSLVSVPANPYAVMNAVQKGLISEEQAQLFPAPMSPEKKETSTDEPHSPEPSIIEVRLTPAEFKEAVGDSLVEFLKGLGLGFLVETDPETKAGAVLSAKNKTALKNAQAMIQQVLDAAEPASEEGKGVTPKPSIYSLALNPGQEPHGGRQAGEPAVDETHLQLTRELLQSVSPAN